MLVYIRISPSIKISCSWPQPTPLGSHETSQIETAIIRNGEIDDSTIFSHNGYTRLMSYIKELKFQNRMQSSKHEGDWSHHGQFNDGEW